MLLTRSSDQIRSEKASNGVACNDCSCCDAALSFRCLNCERAERASHASAAASSNELRLWISSGLYPPR
ncbi:hypothetical protein HNR60_001849 [Rhodopseudomonas rhenobacensis]|uniref:Uncharacterized protein n=1 Tax=Rhodopseudomonas rhenobacensis TaxID=87461 RepID=A0A7W7Z3Q3_9BRAD|nr:hypothetical protein [Rhodopseudomonas rhenobacensis]